MGDGKIQVIVCLLVYYSIMAFVFAFGLSGDAVNNSPLNATNIDNYEGSDPSSFTWSSLFAFLTYGYGLPSDTPSWFSTMFTIWQVVVLILTIIVLVGLFIGG